MKKIRSKIDNQIIGGRVCAKDEVGEADDDRAKVLVARGLAEYVDGQEPGVVVTRYSGQADATETAVRKGPGPVESAIKKG